MDLCKTDALKAGRLRLKSSLNSICESVDIRLRRNLNRAALWPFATGIDRWSVARLPISFAFFPAFHT